MTASEQPATLQLPGLSIREQLDSLREKHPDETPEQRILRMLGPLVPCPRCRERMDGQNEICGLCWFELREPG